MRAALNLPPANRPVLGKGPTGKDKPKPYTPRSQAQTGLDHAEPVASTSAISPSSSSSLTPAVPPISRNESPSSGSTRTHSLSPTNITPALHHSPQQATASMDWEEVMMRKERPDPHQASPVSAGYPISPLSTTQTHPSYPYPPASSTSRQMTMAQVYMQPMPQSYTTHTTDRQQPPADVYSESTVDRRYSYSQPSYSSMHDSSHMHHPAAHSPTTSAAQSIPPHRGNANIQQPISYTHRRSITEPQGYRPVVMNQQPAPSLPQQHAQQQQHPHAVRVPSPSGMRDDAAPMRAVYDIESRVGRMS